VRNFQPTKETQITAILASTRELCQQFNAAIIGYFAKKPVNSKQESNQQLTTILASTRELCQQFNVAVIGCFAKKP
jgi:superfamily II DNA/RNA helicase